LRGDGDLLKGLWSANELAAIMGPPEISEGPAPPQEGRARRFGICGARYCARP